MNTFLRNASFVALLILSVAFLPACGSKANVQSEKAPETVLNPETTPTPEVTPVSSGEENGTAYHTYVQKSYTAKIHRTKGPNSTTTVVTTPTDATTPVITPAATQNTAPMETTAKKSGGSHWFLWFLVLVALGGIGWYFWQKNQEDSFTHNQPKPPTGGLSPVSGFTAVRSHIEDDEKKEPSIWTRKLF